MCGRQVLVIVVVVVVIVIIIIVILTTVVITGLRGPDTGIDEGWTAGWSTRV